MYGNLLYGGGSYANTLFGIYVAEAGSTISNSSGGVLFRGIAVMSTLPGAARIPELDINIDLFAKKEKLGLSFVGYGNFEEFGTEAVHGLSFGGSGLFIPSRIIATGYGPFVIGSTSNIFIVSPNDNLIRWSKIGELDFTIDASNLAGEMPLDWKGYVYAIKQLGESSTIVVYSENGITLITPKDIYYGRKKLLPVGLKSKLALITTENAHYFITTFGDLYKFSAEGLNRLGYREFLSGLGTIAMSYDKENDFIYICDGTTGYVYSIVDDSLAAGPGNITGMYYRDGIKQLLASDEISLLPFELCTDVLNFGTNKEKTITSLDYDIDVDQTIFTAIDFKVGLKTSWARTPWMNIEGNESVPLTCYGTDFRFRLRSDQSLTEGYFSGMKINGFVEDFKPSDIDERF